MPGSLHTAAVPRPASQIAASEIESSPDNRSKPPALHISIEPLTTPLGVVGFRFVLLDRLFNFHVVKLFRIKHIATFKALNKFRVFKAGNDANLRVFAGGNHSS